MENKEEFDALLEESGDKLVVIDFHAAWCGPCKLIGPKFVKMAEDYPDAVFVKVDVDENEETAEACEVEAMPTFQLFRNGEKIDGMTGSDATKLKELIDKHYSS